MKQALKYSLRVWITTALLWPIYITVISIFFYKEKNDWNDFTEPWWVGPLLLLGELILSIPSCGITYLLSASLIGDFKIRRIKTILSILSPLLCILPTVLLSRGHIYIFNTYEFVAFYLTYCAALNTCIWLYRLKPYTSVSKGVISLPK